MVIETLANPYLEGNYAPVREETEAENLRIIGELPKAMDGMYAPGQTPSSTRRASTTGSMVMGCCTACA